MTKIKEIEGKKTVYSAADFGVKDLIIEAKVSRVTDKYEPDCRLFPWPVEKFDLTKALGLGGIVGIESMFQFCELEGDASFFTQSMADPNVYMVPVFAAKSYRFEAARPIQKGEKLVCVLAPESLESVVCF